MKGLMGSTCVAALLASAIAFVPGVTFAQDAAAQGGKDKPQAASSNGGVTEIVVTAQRRSEKIKDVPVEITAISAATAEQLDIKDMQTMQIVTPGLSVSTGVGYAMTYIRGVGASFSNPGVENPVAVYIDGAYVERGKGGNFDLLDTSSMQILKGPQGTLWGRNATGGAILINSADPSFVSTGSLVSEVGSEGHRSIDAVVNIPLSDSFALRVAARTRGDDGYIRNLPDNYMLGWDNEDTVRAKLLYRPNSDFSAVLEVQHDDQKSSLGANAEFLPNAYCLLCAQSGYTHPYANPYTTAIKLLNNGVGEDGKNDFFNLKLKYDFGKVTVTNITSYDDNSTLDAGVFDLTNVVAANDLDFIIPSSNKTFTDGLTATTNWGGMVEATAGVDILHDMSTYAINIVPNLSPPYQPANLAYVTTDSLSPYAEVNITPVDKLKVTIGGRYTSDTRHGHRTGEPDAHVSFHSFSPRFVVAYDFGSTNLYASYNKGTKAGGFSTPAVPMQEFLPETLTAYEAGLKFLSSDHQLRANLAAFHYDYNQLQTVAINQGSGNNIGTVQNPNAKLDGIDADLDWRPTKWVEVFSGVTFLKSRYENFPNAAVQIPTYSTNGNVTGTTTGTANLNGVSLPHAPKSTAFVGATLSGNVSHNWAGELTGFVNYSSAYDFFPDGGGPLHADVQPAFTTARLSGSIHPADDNYEIGFYIDNLTDVKTYNLRFTTAPFGAFQLINRPRTFGLRLKVQY